MSTQKASSSSTPSWKYDVFLSFRGEDTRNSFTDHLYTALKYKGIDIFKDEEKLKRGKSIQPELLKAIEESRFAIVILSRNYASSTWCLNELEKIIRCMKEMKMRVLPIFYDVDPSNVRKQTGTFAQAFAKHEEHFKENIEKVQAWRIALREVANLKGWHLPDGPESKIIQNIVGELWHNLNYAFSEDLEGLVGIISQVEKLKSCLAIGSNDIRIIGVWGMGGIGKTTLARVVFRMISKEFEGCCFLSNVREVSKNDGLVPLQQQLIFQLFNESMSIQDVDVGVSVIKNRLRDKRIILVLDDVNQFEQLEKLAEKHNWFGSGSRVIITTRDKHLLQILEVDKIYDVEGLNDDKALHLLSLKAFKKDHPPKDYLELSKDVVHYAKGLPLAIEILGSFLSHRSIDEWKSTLNRIKEFPESKILEVLQISFDGLHKTEKEIFLHIACFFNHKFKNYVVEILDYLGLYPDIGLRVLVDKSLIKINENRLWMHDLLQEMGRNIVHTECPEELGKRSRLWLFEDINDVLTENTGTKEIQGIVLNMLTPKEAHWNPESFSKMQHLKLLIIDNVYLLHDPKHLPNGLRILDWSGYPSKSFPPSFQPKSFERLKSIRLTKSLKLIETPSFTETPVLERLVLKDCVNLPGVHPSIGVHKKLKVLNLKGCKNLKSLPNKFEMESLEILTLSGCAKVKKIPEFGGNMERVCKLYLDGTAITKLPMSIEHLSGLASLNLRNCKNLVCLPDTIFNLKLLKDVGISGCSKLGRLPENLGNAKSVLKLYLDGTAITKLPTSIEHLTGLTSLNLRDCKNLVCLPNTIFNLKLLKDVDISGCSKLKRLPENLGNAESVVELDVSGTAIRQVPSSIILLKNLKRLSFRGCKGLSLSNKSWYEFLPFYSMPRGPDPMDLLSSSLSGLCSLTKLDLRECNLKAIPNDFGCLFSLKDLFLNGNDFVCLPESIGGLSNLSRMWLDNCTSLQSLPKLPLNVWEIGARGCISLQMLPDQLKVAQHLYLDNCSKLTVNQGFIDMYIAMISKYLQGLLSSQDIDYINIVIPGSVIPEWCSHQSMGAELYIKEPSHLCNDWIGIAVCAVFCSNLNHSLLSWSLIVNGNQSYLGRSTIEIFKILSDHLWLIYVTPEIFNDEWKKSVLDCDANEFCQIGIRIYPNYGFGSVLEVKKCGLHMVYKKDIEDLIQTTAQCSNNNITPYEGLDVPHHNFVKRSGDDYDGAGPSGEGCSNDVHTQKRIERLIEFMSLDKTDCEESSEYKECGEELSDWQESSESDLEG